MAVLVRGHVELRPEMLLERPHPTPILETDDVAVQTDSLGGTAGFCDVRGALKLAGKACGDPCSEAATLVSTAPGMRELKSPRR